MQVWEAHRALSLQLGDSVGLERLTSAPNIIPDGVRTSTALRNAYLYRAMLHLMNTMLRDVVLMPRQTATDIIYKLYPNMIARAHLTVPSIRTHTFRDVTAEFSLDDFAIMYLLSVQVNKNGGQAIYPIPIKHALQKNGLMNPRNAQKCDAFCTLHHDVVGTGSDPTKYRLYMYDPNNTLWDTQPVPTTSHIYIIYLPYPTDPQTQNPDANITFEESYMSLVLQYATLFGMGDNQDLSSPERFYPITLNSNISGGHNAGPSN